MDPNLFIVFSKKKEKSIQRSVRVIENPDVRPKQEEEEENVISSNKSSNLINILPESTRRKTPLESRRVSQSDLEAYTCVRRVLRLI